MDYKRPYILKDWIRCLEDISKEFPGGNTNIGTALRSFKSQLKEINNQ